MNEINNLDRSILNSFNHRAITPDLVDQYGHSIQGSYFQGIEAARQYCFDVLTGIRKAGRAEIGACSRFVSDMQRTDIELREDYSNLVIVIANSLKHPKGPLAGQPFYLLPFMIFILIQMFGWYYTDAARETLIGQRRFIKTFWAVARGNSKTVVAAIASIANMVLNENGSPIGTCSAPVQRQSRIAFEDIGKMISSASPSIRSRFRVLRDEIRVLDSGGKIIPTSSEAKSLDGFRIAGLAVCDEIHAHPNGSIVDVLSTGMQSSKDPQLLMITTAGTDSQSYGREMMDYAVSVATGEVENDRFLSVVYAIDKEDEENWENEECWDKSNPALGHAVSLEGLRNACVEAKRNESSMANFKTKHLNCWVDYQENSFLNMGEMIDCRDESLKIEDFAGCKCYIGLDLAGVSDLSSLVYLFPDDEGSVAVFQKSYLPRSATRSMAEKDQDRYYNAARAGKLIITESEVTDFEYIKNDIIKAKSDYDVLGIGIDAAAGGIRFAADMEEEHDVEILGVKQGFGLSDSATMLQLLIKEGKFKYDGDRLLEWCYRNARAKESVNGETYVHRSKNNDSLKIDICIATLIGLSLVQFKEQNNDFIRFM
ncbi:TPA: terminase large subunit [Aeromonas salmonicida subsp. pectinolytica]